MIERFYQPDFNGIFGKKHANAFLYPQVDSLIWPIFSDVEKSVKLKELLKLKNDDGHALVYKRNITIQDEQVELFSSNIKLGLIQAMEIGRKYGISNEDVVNTVSKNVELFKGILSYNPDDKNTTEMISDIKAKSKLIDVAGIVLYPSLIKEDILSNSLDGLKELLAYCRKAKIFLKLDIGNSFLPNNNKIYSSPENIQNLLSNLPAIPVILSGLDFSGDYASYYQLLKYFNNLWIEIDPRSFGGLTPTNVFKDLFERGGFIQNAWHRITIGSATPTLEISQMIRGFLEATEMLPFSQKCILRTWGLRNVNRLNPKIFKPLEDKLDLFHPVQAVDLKKRIESDNEVNFYYKINLRSYSITQLIFLTDLIKNTLQKTLKEHPNFKNGEMLVRSYHTTTSLVVNEHEHGNFLDLHYMFAEKSAQDSSSFLHTVKALENRADFNHYDHELATTYGNRQLILPILDGKLEIGGRENFYILVTFGPRTFNLLIKVKLIKEKD